MQGAGVGLQAQAVAAALHAHAQHAEAQELSFSRQVGVCSSEGVIGGGGLS